MDKRANELAMVGKDIRALRDSSTPDWMKCDGNLHEPRIKTRVLKNISQNSVELGRTWTEGQFSFIRLVVFEFA